MYWSWNICITVCSGLVESKCNRSVYRASSNVGQWVRFIFLHRPLLEPQGWREGVGERVCARNSQHQDDELVAPRGPPSVRWKQEQVDGIAETPVLPRRRGSTRRGSAAAGCQLAADSCAALVDGPPLPPRSRSTADCRPRCAAPAWD